MKRGRFAIAAAALVFMLGLAMSTTAVPTSAAQATAATTTAGKTTAPNTTAPNTTAPRTGAPLGAQQPVTSATPSAPAEFVGSETCVACHDGMDDSIAATIHGKAAHPRSPAAAQGCETCHGAGSLHVEDPSTDTAFRKFDRLAPRVANETCLTCHTSSTHAMWDGSAHEARNMSCLTCHSVHAPGPTAQLKAATELELCAACHRVQAMKMKRVSHMPVVEGKLVCTSCHNPHGATNVKLLRVGNWVNESCIACHTEKRGPFLFEHAAGRESCVSCHDPHGSSNDRMLVAKAPMLCQRCHIGTRHPSTIYDNLAVQGRSNRIVGRACINCHQQIHGSNHPSGQSLTR